MTLPVLRAFVRMLATTNLSHLSDADYVALTAFANGECRGLGYPTWHEAYVDLKDTDPKEDSV